MHSQIQAIHSSNHFCSIHNSIPNITWHWKSGTVSTEKLHHSVHLIYQPTSQVINPHLGHPNFCWRSIIHLMTPGIQLCGVCSIGCWHLKHLTCYYESPSHESHMSTQGSYNVSSHTVTVLFHMITLFINHPSTQLFAASIVFPFWENILLMTTYPCPSVPRRSVPSKSKKAPTIFQVIMQRLILLKNLPWWQCLQSHWWWLILHYYLPCHWSCQRG